MLCPLTAGLGPEALLGPGWGLLEASLAGDDAGGHGQEVDRREGAGPGWGEHDGLGDAADRTGRHDGAWAAALQHCVHGEEAYARIRAVLRATAATYRLEEWMAEQEAEEDSLSSSSVVCRED